MMKLFKSMGNHLNSAVLKVVETILVWLFISVWFVTLAKAEKKSLVDAIAVSDYVAPITPLTQNHNSKILIDRFHNTIYKLPEAEQGTAVMLDIMKRDGFEVSYLNEEINNQNLNTDLLIIHGLPNEKVAIHDDLVYWRSPLATTEVDAIVNWVANGGGLFLTLSHFPGGSGAKPLLEAFEVQFRDGYLYSPTFPSFVSEDSRCSHFFGMGEKHNLVRKLHPLMAMGEEVNKVDFHCGAAVFRQPEDVILAFPEDAANYDKHDRLLESSADYAGIIGFPFGKGKVVIATDQGLFRNFLFTFNTGEKVHVTITNPENDNARLFTNIIRWLSAKI